MPCFIDQIVVNHHIPAFRPIRHLAFSDFDVLDELQQHFPVKLFDGNILLDALELLLNITLILCGIGQPLFQLLPHPIFVLKYTLCPVANIVQHQLRQRIQVDNVS